MGFLRKTSGKGKVGAGIAALFAVIAGMVALAAPASAHHSNISASAACATGPGGWRLSWTASTWSANVDEGSHPGVLVEYSFNGGAWTTVPNDSSAMPYADAAQTPIAGVGVFRNPGSPDFTGTIDFPPSAVDQFVQVRSTPIDNVPASGPWFWNDNFFLPADGGTSLDTRAAGADLTWLNGVDSEVGQTTSSIKLKGGECQPPANPSVEIKDLCATKHGQTGINILLSNTGGQSATFNVAGVGNTVVAANATATVFVPVAEDAIYSVAVTVGGNAVPGSPIAGTRDCLTPSPAASVTDECATDQAGAPGIEITLTNTGTQAVTIDVEGAGSHLIAAGGSKVVFVAVAEDADYSIDVKVGGSHLPNSPLSGTRDCATPEPSFSLSNECAVNQGVEGIELTLTNSGDQAVTINVEGIGDTVVGPNTSTVVFVPVAEGAAYSIDVIALGGPVDGSPVEGTRDCRHPDPSAELEDECAVDGDTEGISITLTNTGDDDATFQVDGGSDITVAAGASQTVFVPVAENSAYSIEVTSGGQTVATIEGTRDCRHPDPSAELEDECAVVDEVEGVSITLTNTGDDDATFQVDGGSDVTVAAGASETVFVPVAENSAYSITVTSGGQTVATIEGTRDCRHGVASSSVENECAVDGDTEGVAVKLTNTGDDDVIFQVNGGSDVTVAAGASETVFVPVAENSDYTITVTSGGQTVATFEGTRDCRHGVAGVVITEVCATQEGVEGILLTLTNTGDDDLAFQVDGGSDHVVAAGASIPVFVPIVENSTYAISVTSLGATVGLLEGTRDCRQAEVSVELGDECAEGGIEIVVTNAGDEDATVEVDGEETEVPAGSTVTVVVAVDENDDYSITVTFDGETVGTFEGTRNCEVDFLQLDAVGDCFDNVARISWDVGVDLPNDGQTLTIRWYDLDGNLQLTQSGLPLAGSAAWPGIVIGPDGGAVDWPGWFQDDEGNWVQGDDGFEWARPTVRITFEVNPTSDPIEVDYPPAEPGCTDPPTTPPTTAPPIEVEGVQNPRPLPRTGSESSRSLVVGLALLISGAGVVLLAADRRRAASR